LSEVASALLPVFGLLFIVGSMLAMGFSLTIKMIAQPLKNWKIVVLALTANFVIIPIVIIGLGSILPLPADVRYGFFILALAAGAPFLPKLAQFAKANIAFAVGLMTLLMVVTIVILPIFLPLLVPGIGIDPLAIAEPLIFLMLLPLGIALAIRHRYEAVAEHVAKLLNPVTSFSMLALLFLLFVVYWNEILSTFGTGAILFSIFFITFSLAVGYFVSIKDTGIRQVSGLGAAQRNISAGILVAAVNFPGQPLVAITVLVISLVGLVFMIIAAGEWGRKKQ